MIKVNMPLVSVIIPVYNAERFVDKAIRSVLEQTYQNLELILIDDGSTDGSRQIIQAYADKDPRVRILTNEGNQGVAQTRNHGIRAAAGEYIALLDSDDVWKPAKLEQQVHLMQTQDADICYTSMDFIDENDQWIKDFLVPQTTNYHEMLTRCYFSCSTIMIDAELLKAHPFRTDFYHEDFLLWTELLTLNVKTVGIVEILAHYRQINGSRSHRKFRAAINRWRIYRDALGMSFYQCLMTFMKYALQGVCKYYL